MMKWYAKFVFLIFAIILFSFSCSNDKTTDPGTGGDETVTDIDDNTYQAIEIGNQCWMAENLKVTSYRDGTPIPNVTDITDWSNLKSGAYCNYDNDEDNVDTYGRLYNWYAVNDPRGLAPEGWHVPTDAEWKQLEMYLGMSQSQADAAGWRGTNEGDKLKEAGTTLWNSPNTDATNASGFSALPGGYRDVRYVSFDGLGLIALFWSSTEHNFYDLDRSWHRGLTFNQARVLRWYTHSGIGFSVRCVRD